MTDAFDRRDDAILERMVNGHAAACRQARLRRERSTQTACAALTGLGLAAAALLSALTASRLPEVLSWGLAVVAAVCAVWQFRAAAALLRGRSHHTHNESQKGA